MDKDASWFEALGALGFGFVEVGTVTALAQDGNPRPRVFRLPADRGLLNSMGFPNPGAAATAGRLRGRTASPIVGVNVGKSRIVDVQDAGPDYRACIREVAPYADYLVLNVSSPNTPGLRGLQSVELLGALLDAVQDQAPGVPLLVKIGSDLGDEELDALAALALERGVDGIVAVNTTVTREGLKSAREAWDRPGGVSGAPLKRRALHVLKRLHAAVGDRLVLISVGGVETADDVWERVLAGATLVQAYTGFVYGGPLWPSRVNRALAKRVRASGARSIRELVGTGDQAVSARKAGVPLSPT
jgi:dihydroorotate dehydrogenase